MVNISRAKWSDSFPIRKLKQQVRKDKATPEKDENIFTRFEYIFVAREKNKVIGAILAIKTVKDEIYIENIIISPKWQHQGIEKRLYETLLAYSGNVPVLAIVNTTNEESIHLLKELGFKGIKKVKNFLGVDTSTESFLMCREKKE